MFAIKHATKELHELLPKQFINSGGAEFAKIEVPFCEVSSRHYGESGRGSNKTIIRTSPRKRSRQTLLNQTTPRNVLLGTVLLKSTSFLKQVQGPKCLQINFISGTATYVEI
jgi:hypothetical protein